MFNDFFTPVPKNRNVRIRGKKGIIFNNLNFAEKSLFYVSNLVFISAVLYLFYLYQPLVKAIWNYKFSQPVYEELPTSKVIIPTPMPNNEYDLIIPKIKAVAPIVSNVSPFDRDEYLKVLSENKVALAKGSYDPGSGMGKSTFIFAHSTSQGINLVRNNSVFYLLDDLANGDEILINMKGNIFKYNVYDKKIVSAKDIEYLSYSDPTREVLILQTCWPIGTDWKRLLVFANKE